MQMHTINGPVRKIRISSRAITGTVPKVGDYESLLERDMMQLVRFDKNIHLFTPQPLTLWYEDAKGNKRSYTPDGFIEYRRDIAPAKDMPHVLCEIKYRADFRAKWKELLPRFRAAKRYCQERGWEFHVFTEREIRTAYLENVRFLWRYHAINEDNGFSELIRERIREMGETDPTSLLNAICRDKWNQAVALPVLWHLVCNAEIGCDLNLPLTMHTRIWSTEAI